MRSLIGRVLQLQDVPYDQLSEDDRAAFRALTIPALPRCTRALGLTHSGDLLERHLGRRLRGWSATLHVQRQVLVACVRGAGLVGFGDALW